MKSPNCIIVLFIFIFSLCANSTSTISYKAKSIAQFKGVVWGFSFISVNEALVTLRQGDLYYYNFSTQEKIKLPAPKVKSSGQGGLLDVYIHNKDGIKEL